MVLMALVVYSASDIFMPSIAYMAEDLGVSEAVATSNFSSYYLMLMILSLEMALLQFLQYFFLEVSFQVKFSFSPKNCINSIFSRL